MKNLIVLGTDEQLDLAGVKIEVPSILPETISKTENYALRNYSIPESSCMIGFVSKNLICGKNIKF
jgi:hypothetical protein